MCIIGYFEECHCYTDFQNWLTHSACRTLKIIIVIEIIEWWFHRRLELNLLYRSGSETYLGMFRDTTTSNWYDNNGNTVWGPFYWESSALSTCSEIYRLTRQVACTSALAVTCKATVEGNWEWRVGAIIKIIFAFLFIFRSIEFYCLFIKCPKCISVKKKKLETRKK